MRTASLLLLAALLSTSQLDATSLLRQPGEPQASAEHLLIDTEPTTAPRHIPILALYTPERLSHVGGLSNLTNQLNDELRALNQSLQVSGILDYDFVFSAIELADHHDSGSLSADITWLATAWPPSRVAAANARLVHLFVATAQDFGGLSSGITHPASASVAPERTEPGIYVLAHEVGHSLGLSHDPAHTPEVPEWNNGHGFRMAGYRDVMASSAGCLEEFGTFCELAAGFSDPARLRDGRPLGVPGVSDAVSVLRETLPFIAGDTTCAAAPRALCLSNHRFRIATLWRTPDEQTSAGWAIARTADTGEFWFFSPTNIELIVKVLDACSLNSHFWVFAGGLTNVDVLITVTDTATGAVRSYHNPQGTAFQPIQDTAAFDCS